MTATTEQFSKIAQQGQDAVNTAVRSWADAVQRLSGSSATTDLPDLSAVVDQTFDFAATLLATQRELTKTVLEAVASTTSQMTSQMTSSAAQVAQAYEHQDAWKTQD